MAWELIERPEADDFPYTRVKWFSPLTENPDTGICVRPGDSVEGHILDYSPVSGDTDYNKKECGYVDLQISDGPSKGEVARITLDKGPLKDGLKGVPDPKPGQQIRVKFLGKVESRKAGGRPWNDYEVYTDREGYDPSIVAAHNVATL